MINSITCFFVSEFSVQPRGISPCPASFINTQIKGIECTRWIGVVESAQAVYLSILSTYIPIKRSYLHLDVHALKPQNRTCFMRSNVWPSCASYQTILAHTNHTACFLLARARLLLYTTACTCQGAYLPPGTLTYAGKPSDLLPQNPGHELRPRVLVQTVLLCKPAPSKSTTLVA